MVLSYFLLSIFNDQFKFCMLTINSLERTSTIDLVILTCWWFIFIDMRSFLQMVLITSSERKCHSKQLRQDSSLGACKGIIYTLISVTLTHLFTGRSSPLSSISLSIKPALYTLIAVIFLLPCVTDSVSSYLFHINYVLNNN